MKKTPECEKEALKEKNEDLTERSDKYKKKKEYIKTAVIIGFFLAVAVVLTVIFWDNIAALATEEGRAELKSFIDGIGFWGWLVTFGVQILQILIAVLPGEPVELMLGFMWGPVWGTLTCLLGIFIGTAIIYFFAKWLGKPFIHLVVGDEDEKRYKFLHDKQKLELTVFILFFIPGTPKDVLTYIVPMTPIKPVRYFLIATFARIPSIVTSTILGDSVMQGDYVLTIAVFIITAIISVGGIVFGNRYLNKKQKKSDEIDQKDC